LKIKKKLPAAASCTSGSASGCVDELAILERKKADTKPVVLFELSGYPSLVDSCRYALICSQLVQPAAHMDVQLCAAS